MSKKFRIYAIAASVVLLLVSGSWAYAQESRFEGITLTIAYEGGCLHIEAALESLPEWEKLTGAKVNRAGMPNSELSAKTVLELTTHSGVFDIVYHPDAWVVPIEEYLLDLTDGIPEIGRFDKTRLEMLTFNGKVKAIPHTYETSLLFYNKNVCAAAGLTELAPRTIDDLLEILDKIQAILPSGDCKYGYARSPWHRYAAALFSLYSGKNIMEIDPKDGLWHPMWNSPEGVQALEMVRQFGKYAPPDYVAINPTSDRALFTRGEVAIVSEWPDVWMKFNDPNESRIAGKIATSAWPKAKYLMKQSGGWDVMVVADVEKKGSLHKEAAVDLANFLTSLEVSKKMVLACGTGSPQPRVMTEILAEDDAYNAAYRRSLIESLYYSFAMPFVPVPSDSYRLSLKQAVFSAVLGEKTAKQALADAERETIETLKDLGYYQ